MSVITPGPNKFVAWPLENGNVKLSSSPYDTAWVAMVPSPSSSSTPRFPQCLRWIINNQLPDGSWTLCNSNPCFLKDSISSTLACVLALKRWGMAEQIVDKGLHFIGLNSTALSNPDLIDPLGFEIIFPGMIDRARSLGLTIPVKSADLNAISLNKFDFGSDNPRRKEAYLAYVSEGIGRNQDWVTTMKFKRKNGSLFNSPSATSSAAMYAHDHDCYSYLDSLVNKFGDSVPTTYPLNVYPRLCLIDSLVNLGIERHFRNEIASALDQTHRLWTQGDEEIFKDSATCAMAFRLLRANGYEVDSDSLLSCLNDCFFASLDTVAVLEAYRATQLCFTNEPLLDEYNSKALRSLTDGSYFARRSVERIANEVHDAVKFPYHGDLQRLANRRCIENFAVDGTMITKSSFRCENEEKKEILVLAIEDFNLCQSMHSEELQELGRWVTEMKLDKLKFARQKLSHCYFSGAATLFSPEESEARVSWVKNGVLTTVVDDFFDVGGSKEELTNLVDLIRRWEVYSTNDLCSENVEIVFSAIRHTVSEIARRAEPKQGRDVTPYIAKIVHFINYLTSSVKILTSASAFQWLDLVTSMMKEHHWSAMGSAPTFHEYMENGTVSFALGPIVLPALYLIGPKLPETTEYDDMYVSLSRYGRLLNDWRTFERESKEGKLNAVSLVGSDSMGKMKSMIRGYREDLKNLVFGDTCRSVPIRCRKVFWNMAQVLHVFYSKDDGFTSNDLIQAAHAVMKSPITRAVSSLVL